VFAGLVLASTQAWGDGPSFPTPPLEEQRLLNGLRVVLAPDDALPDVSILVRYDVGSADDPDGLEGLAHVVEHLEFDGSTHVAQGGHARLLTSAGATNINGQTTRDDTLYMETVPPGALDLALWLEAERMAFVSEHLHEAAVTRERAIVGREYSEKGLNQPLGILSSLVSNEVYPDWHPYHASSEPFTDIDRIGLGDVQAFIRTWYTPGNATIIIAGHFDPNVASALVDKYFGARPAREMPARPPLPTPPPPGDLWLGVSLAMTREYSLMSWRTPSLGEPADRALDVVARILAGPDGRLTRKFVRGDGGALAINAQQASFAQGSTFYVSVMPSGTVPIRALVPLVQAVVASLPDDVSDDEVAAAKRWLKNRRERLLETSMGRAIVLADPSHHGTWGLDEYLGIDRTSVADAARRYLAPRERVTLVAEQGFRWSAAGLQAWMIHRDRRMP
jgi:predicted Zn-dependent peptidase